MAAALLRVSPFLFSPRLALACFARFRLKPRPCTQSRPISASPLISSSSTPSASSSPLPFPHPPPSVAPPAAETVAPSLPSESLAASPLQWVARTGYCGDLGVEDVGKRVRLCGWVALHRIHGGLTFFNLRDSSGIVQVTTLPTEYPDAYSIVNKLRLEYVVAAEGTVRSRPRESVNKKMKTGYIEEGKAISIRQALGYLSYIPVTDLVRREHSLGPRGFT